MPCTEKTVTFSGLNIWSGEAGASPVADIIAVQGLGAHPYYTWVKKISKVKGDHPKRFRDKVRFWKNKSEDEEDDLAECMWLRDLLVPLFRNARIATYSYKSDWRDRSVKTSLWKCAEQFLNILKQHRQKADELQRPIVLIGHSLGSLVIQQALVIAVHEPEFANLRLSVAGIIFLGAPFQGSDAAVYGKWLAQLSGRDTTVLEMLKKESPSLHELSRLFWGSFGKWDIVCFYEDLEADYKVLSAKIVSSHSASLVGKRMISLNSDHSGLNKFGGDNDENYRLVLPELQRMVDGGASIIADRHRARETDASVHGNVHWMVPRVVNKLFTGRAKLLDRMRKTLQNDSTSIANQQKRFVITGLGGQGKSEVCVQVASLMREEFWGVFWVDVSNPATSERDFITIAIALGRTVDRLPDALQVLAATKQSWLLILDNADDPDVDYQDYLPSGTHGAVLITSRVPECKQYSPDAFEALEGLKDQDSKELLLKAAELSQELWPSYNNQAKEVVDLLGSHTLALIQAGAYIARGHCQLHQYPEEYQRQRKCLLEYRPKQANSRYRDVYATFEASAAVLEKSNGEDAKDALRLLEILSMLDFSVLPLQIFQDAWNGCKEVPGASRPSTETIGELSQSHVSHLPTFMVAEENKWHPYRLIEATALLASLSLITRHDLNGSPGVSMHPLTHAWAKDRQKPDQQDRAWIISGCVLGFSRVNNHFWQTQERRLLPHMLSYLDIDINTFMSASEAILIPVLLKCGWALLDMRQDSKLGKLLQDIFAKLKQTSDQPSEEYLPLYDLQAKSLSNLGKSKKAVALLEQVVKIRATMLAEDHPDRLASQHALAIAYRANGQVTEAVALLEQVVKIRATLLAEDHPDRLASQQALAIAYWANGQVTEAVALLEQVVKICATMQAEDHPNRLASQHTLAIAYEANGQVTKAVALLEQVVKIEAITLAEDHPDRLASQHALAIAYWANGQVTEAVALLEQVVKIRATLLAKDHPDRLASQHALAVAYGANGQVTEAVALLEQVVKIQAITLAKDHPDRLASQHALAVAYRANGQVTKAVALLEQVVKIRATLQAEDHPDRLASQHALAIAYQANGQVTEAVALLEQVVKIRATLQAEDHPDRLASQHALAVAYRANGQVTKAVVLLEQVVKIKAITLAKDHPDRLASQHALAVAYQANGQVKQAVMLLK